MYRLTN